MYFPLFVGVLRLYLFCYALLCVHSSFAIILKRKTKQVALLLLSYRCIVTIIVLWLFLMVPWVGLQCVIVVFPDHTHLLLDPFKFSRSVIIVVDLSITHTPTILLAIKCTVIDFSITHIPTVLLAIKCTVIDFSITHIPTVLLAIKCTVIDLSITHIPTVLLAIKCTVIDFSMTHNDTYTYRSVSYKVYSN